MEEEDLLPSDDFQEELLKLNDSTNSISKKRPLFNPEDSSNSSDDDKNDNNNNTTESKEPEGQSNQGQLKSNSGESDKGEVKDYTGQEDYAQESFYKPTGFGQGGLFMRNKRLKLQVQHKAILEDNNDGEIKPQIFKGLKLYINGLTDKMGLRQLTEELVKHGGTHVVFLDHKTSVTHIIATILTPKKFEEFKSYKVAQPEWLLDSIEKGKLLDWNDYSTFAAYGKSSNGTMKGINDNDRMGTQVPQMSLFDLGVSKGKGKEKEINQGGSEASGSKLKKIESIPVAPVLPLPKTRTSESTTNINTDNPFLNSKSPSKASTSNSNSPYKGDVPHHWLPTVSNNTTSDAIFSDPAWLKENTAQNPNFLKSYFAQSRLSRLSQWKQELITLAHNLQLSTKLSDSDSKSKGKKKLLTGLESDNRIIMHVDFDCFFVSAGLIGRPDLIGKAVAVCHTDGDMKGSTSEIASCSYEARKHGVVNGMTFGRAQELCSNIISIPFEFDLYKSISLKLYKILLSHSSFLQAVSVDECLLEVHIAESEDFSSPESNDPALDLARQIRSEILTSTGCSVSIGVSHNVLLAKLATRKAKPASVYHLMPQDIASILSPLSVDCLPGIGFALAKTLEEKLNVKTIEELRGFSEAKLKETLGDLKGTTFFNYARGIDARELAGKGERGSVEVAVNYAIRFTEMSQVKTFLLDLAGHLSERLKKESLIAQSITLSVKKRDPSAPIIAPKFLGHGFCTTHTTSASIGVATDDSRVLGTTAWQLMQAMKIPSEELRGIAISAGKVKVDSNDGKRGSQGMLVFGKVEKPGTSKSALVKNKDTTSISTIVSGPSTSKPIKALSKEPSVIILGDSDSDPSSPPPPPPSPKKKTKKITQPVKIPSKIIPVMFNKPLKSNSTLFPTASQVTDSDLKIMGFAPDVFRVLPVEDQIEAIRQVKISSKGLSFSSNTNSTSTNGQSILIGKASKPGSSNNSNRKSKSSTEPIPSSSPVEITDESILKLNYLPEAFRELPLQLQQEIIKASVKNQRSLTVTGDRKAENTRIQTRLINLIDFKPELIPRFIGKTDLDDIREALEQWFDSWNSQAPEYKDVEQFILYLEKCVDARNVGKGRDLNKVKSLIEWWEFLIDDKFGPIDICKDDIGLSWWQSAKGAKERINFYVKKEFGGGTVFV